MYDISLSGIVTINPPIQWMYPNKKFNVKWFLKKIQEVLGPQESPKHKKANIGSWNWRIIFQSGCHLLYTLRWEWDWGHVWPLQLCFSAGLGSHTTCEHSHMDWAQQTWSFLTTFLIFKRAEIVRFVAFLNKCWYHLVNFYWKSLFDYEWDFIESVDQFDKSWHLTILSLPVPKLVHLYFLMPSFFPSFLSVMVHWGISSFWLNICLRILNS
jgi:hypothetical protein